jgi:hypothetical protein
MRNKSYNMARRWRQKGALGRDVPSSMSLTMSSLRLVIL